MQHGSGNVEHHNLDGMILSSTADVEKKQTREEMIVQAVKDGTSPVSVVNQHHPEAKFTIVGDVVYTSKLTVNDETFLGIGSDEEAANIRTNIRANITYN